MGGVFERLGKLAVLLPLAHVIACSIFLTGYDARFGLGVSSLFTFSDLFSVSLSNMIFIYASGLFLPLFLFWFNYHAPSKPPIVFTSQEEKDRYFKPIAATVRGFEAAFALIIVLILVLVATEWYNDTVIVYIALLWPFMFYGSRPFFKVLTDRGSTLLSANYIWFLTIFAVTAFISGVSQGSLDSRMPFDSYLGSTLGCNDVVILRRADTRFIAVRRDNRRIVVDDKCKTVFEFPKVKPFYTGRQSFFGLFNFGKAQ